MDCPACGGESSVSKSMSIGAVVMRRRTCPCGARWATEETTKRGTLVATGAISAQRGPPVARINPTLTSNGGGGVGGGLSSGSDLGPIRSQIFISNPEIGSGARARDPAALQPFRAPMRAYPVAAVTLPFLDVYDAYPRRHKKLPAAAVWNEVAAEYPGGESELSRAILARFADGFLRRPPYAGPIKTCPTLEAFLANRSWEDADDDTPVPDARAGPAPKNWTQEANDAAIAESMRGRT